MSFLNKIQGVLKLRIKEQWVFKTDYFIKFLAFPLMLLVTYFAWKAIYLNTGKEIINGFTFVQIISYYITSFFVSVFVSTDAANNVAVRVQHGTLVKHLLRPIHTFFYDLIGRFSGILVDLVLIAPLFWAVSIIFFKFEVGSVQHVLLFIVVLLMAVFLNYLIMYLIGTTAFWFKSVYGINDMLIGLTYFMTGAIIPLTFFPGIAQKIAEFLPFQYVRYVPAMILTGKLSVLDSLKALGIQVAWIIILALIFKVVYDKGIKHFSGVGI